MPCLQNSGAPHSTRKRGEKGHYRVTWGTVRVVVTPTTNQNVAARKWDPVSLHPPDGEAVLKERSDAGSRPIRMWRERKRWWGGVASTGLLLMF